MRVLGINGIRTDGASSTDKVIDMLTARGHKGIDVNYPKVNIFQSRSKRRQYANASILLNAHRQGDTLVAHSYGCLIALRAMELGARFGQVFFFAPAMNRDFVFPYHGMEKLTVIHNRTDQAISLGNLLWRHDFGKMGSHGYKGAPDSRISNLRDFGGSYGSRNHSHYFNDSNIVDWVNFVELKMRGTNVKV